MEFFFLLSGEFFSLAQEECLREFIDLICQLPSWYLCLVLETAAESTEVTTRGLPRDSLPICEAADSHWPPAPTTRTPFLHHTFSLPPKPQALTKGHLSPVVSRLHKQKILHAGLHGWNAPQNGAQRQRSGEVACPTTSHHVPQPVHAGARLSPLRSLCVPCTCFPHVLLAEHKAD